MEHEEQDIRQYLEVLWRRKWVVVLVVVAAVAAAVGLSLVQESVYEAKTTVLIEREEGLGRLLEASGEFFVDRGIQTQMELIRSRDVFGRAARELYGAEVSEEELQGRVEELRAAVRVKQIGTTELVEIAASGTEPGVAKERADAVAAAYVEHTVEGRVEAVNRALQVVAAQVNGGAGDPGAAQLYAQLLQVQQELELAQAAGQVVGIRVIDRALLPTSPVSPRIRLNVLLGLVLGLLVGVGGALGLEYVDRKVRSDVDLKRVVEVPVVGLIPYSKLETNPHLATIEQDPKSAFAEAFRVLRANLQFASVDHPLKCILLASPSPLEGKTVVATNLAQAFALEGKRVLLIDGDLRRPALRRAFQLPEDRGLTTLLVGGDGVEGCVVRVGELEVLLAGPRPPNPAELLGSQKMGELLERFRKEYDVVVVDGPPVLGFVDALVLGKRVDGTVLVVRAGVTNRDAVAEAWEVLQGVEAKVVGSVLNGVRPGYRGYRYRYYYKYYGAEDKGPT